MKTKTNLKAGSGCGCRGGSLINVSDNNVAVGVNVLGIQGIFQS